MPTAGTHITIIERLALVEDFAALLGDPNANEDDPAALQMRYAKLGAIGPDIFYCLMDYDPRLQDFTDTMSRIAGSFECIKSLTKQVDDIESTLTLGLSDVAKKILNELESAFGMITSVVKEELEILAIKKVNLFPFLEARRQQQKFRPLGYNDEYRESWFWADYLHYVNTGQFVRTLFQLSQGNTNLRAFAYGYLSHYVTDVVGHPFVNQVVGGPWRTHWQRHHLVENFIDAYVWDRWHDSSPEPEPTSNEEQLLDQIREDPQPSIGTGAPFTFARLNDHIKIGYAAGGDPVDDLIASLCAKLQDPLYTVEQWLGEATNLKPPIPDKADNKDLYDWADMLVTAFRAVYPAAARPPENLKGLGRPDGYPTAPDIVAAYSLLRLLLKIATEDTLQEPQLPNVAADVWAAFMKTIDDLKQNLPQTIPLPIPAVNISDGPSLQKFWKAFCDWLRQQLEFAKQSGQAAIQFVRDSLAVGGVLLVDLVRIGLYGVKSQLFTVYKYLREYLVRAGYAVPFTDELEIDLGGGIGGKSLWTTPGGNDYGFPIEEQASLERGNAGYAPWIPAHLSWEITAPFQVVCEEPKTWVSPYDNGQRPDVFIDSPLGPRKMLDSDGPTPLNLDVVKHGFGGAMANCKMAFEAVMKAEEDGALPVFPDYNLDGDRGYGWPCWTSPAPLDPSYIYPVVVEPVTTIS